MAKAMDAFSASLMADKREIIFAPTMTTELLGFDSMDYNVVYAQMGRGKMELAMAFAFRHLSASASALVDKLLDVVVILFVCHQLFNAYMHAVAPIVFRIGGYVDALSVGVGQTKFLVDGEPVLQRQDAEH